MQYQSHPGQEMGLCDEVTLAKKNSKLCVTHILFVMRRNVKRLPGKEQMNVTHFLLVIEWGDETAWQRKNALWLTCCWSWEAMWLAKNCNLTHCMLIMVGKRRKPRKEESHTYCWSWEKMGKKKFSVTQFLLNMRRDVMSLLPKK